MGDRKIVRAVLRYTKHKSERTLYRWSKALVNYEGGTLEFYGHRSPVKSLEYWLQLLLDDSEVTNLHPLITTEEEFLQIQTTMLLKR